MTNSDIKVWLITGSSSGFGRALVEAVLNPSFITLGRRKLEGQFITCQDFRQVKAIYLLDKLRKTKRQA